MGRFRSSVGELLRKAGVAPPAAGFTPAQLQRLHELVDPLQARLDQLSGELAANQAGEPDVLARYCTEAPSPQTAVDIFEGEWAAAFPPPLQEVRAGTAPLFEIDHVPWGVKVLGGVEGQRIVELGPLEGGHTYILDRLGAREVVAVEANTRAFLRCLVSKELLGIPSARFLCGDALRFLERELAHGAEPYDLCLASGVLYHFADPVAALDHMTRSSDRLLLWTMYYDEAYIRSREDLSVKFPSSVESEHRGFRHTLHRQEYQAALDHRGFCGGSAASSSWMTRDDILGAIDHLGFEVLEIGFEEQNHKNNGPCFCLAARRR